MNNNPSKSFFEQEAERIAQLNAAKHKPKVSLTAKLVGWSMAIGIGIIVFLGVFVPLTAYSVIVHGFVFSKLWAWFIVPLGATQVSWLQAAGIIALVRLCTYHVNFNNKSDETDMSSKILRFLTLALIPWMSLVIGYIIHRFV